MHWGLLDRSDTNSERIASPARTDSPAQRKWLGFSRQVIRDKKGDGMISGEVPQLVLPEPGNSRAN